MILNWRIISLLRGNTNERGVVSLIRGHGPCGANPETVPEDIDYQLETGASKPGEFPPTLARTESPSVAQELSLGGPRRRDLGLRCVDFVRIISTADGRLRLLALWLALSLLPVSF